MFRNYIKIAFRNLQKYKGYFFINVVGLALGIAGCLLIFLFIQDEWSYDRFHRDADRIYRMAVEEDYDTGNVYFNTTTPIPLAEAMRENLPEVEEAVRITLFRNPVEHNGVQFSERLHAVDPNFFQVFDFPLIHGTPETVFQELKSVVITEAVAERYFGTTDPVGQTLLIQVAAELESFIVTGVAADVPPNSSIQFSFAMPFENARARWSERLQGSYMNVVPETYIRLPEGIALETFVEKATATIGPIAMGERYAPGMYTLFAQPITDIHLNTDYPAGFEPISDPEYSYILGVIALLVLLIACINFTTLALGRSADRAREVGVRKVMGAMRGQLVRQFWSEALVLTAFGLILGIALAQVLLPTFNTFAGKTLSLHFNLPLLLAIVMLVVVIGLIAGSYPALFLSRFNPVDVFKGQVRMGKTGIFRRALTVVQFAFSIFLVVSTLLVTQQLGFLQDKNLGFEQEAVVVIPTGLSRMDGMALTERFRQALSGHNQIAGVAASTFTFGEAWLGAGYIADDGTYRSLNANMIEPEFIEVMGMTVQTGRNFSREVGADTRRAVLVNEALVAEYGWTDPLSAQLPGRDMPPHEIIGVIQDFNYQSLHTPVVPLVMVQAPDLLNGMDDINISAPPQPKIAVRLRTDDLAGTLALLRSTWETIAPGQDFDHFFLDERLGQQYQQEERLSQIARSATTFAILIACLGLFGLAALIVAKRTKEIGIRKILGASIPNVMMLLSKDFALLVAVAFLVAAPAAYFVMRGWVSDFAYQITIGPWVFLIAGITVLLIALLTVSWQALKAARANPVDALRYE